MAKWNTITENFPGTSLGSLWIFSSGTPTVASNICTINEGDTIFTDYHDLSDSSVLFKWDHQRTSGYATVNLYDGSADVANMYVVPGDGPALWMDIPGISYHEFATPWPYDPEDNWWWKLRHSGSTLYFETSADGVTFTTRGSGTLSGAAVASISLGFLAAGSGSGDTSLSRIGLPPAVNASAGLATVTVTAPAPTTTRAVSATAGLATVTVTANAATVDAISSAPPGVYGMPWHSDSLNNVPVGSNDPSNYAWSLRFKAPSNGTMTNFRVYWVDNSNLTNTQGYAKGTGGTIDIDIRPDDGTGYPDMSTSLATATKTFPTMTTGYIDPRDTSDKITHLFGSITLSAGVALTAGERYHICFENNDAAPTTNWVSFNNNAALDGGSRAPSAPGTADWGLVGWNRDDFAGSKYVESETAYQPILEIGLSDGHAFGSAWMDNFSGARRAINGTNRVRQVFTPAQSMTFTDIGVNLIDVSGAGSVIIELKQGSTVIQTATIAGSSFAGSSSGEWVETTFSASVTAGTEYTIEMRPSGCNVNASPLQDGSEFWGWDVEAGWTNAYAQSSSDSGSTWVGWHTGGQTDLAFDQGDLPVYFKTAASNTYASAVVASVTVAANGAVSAINPSAGVASVTASAASATVQVAPSVGLASVAASATTAQTSITPAANLASVTVTALAATPSTSVEAWADPAFVTISTYGLVPTKEVNGNADVATVAITASGATTTISPNAGNAAISVAANDATIVTSVEATAGLASVTVSALGTTATIDVGAGVSSSTVSAVGTTNEVSATATGSSVTASAFTGTIAIDLSSDVASVSVSAVDAAVEVGTFTSADPVLATATVSAFDAAIAIDGLSDLAPVTATAYDASASVEASAEVATVSATAATPGTAVDGTAEAATASVGAFGASLAIEVAADPSEVAVGASTAVSELAVSAALASVTASALDATASAVTEVAVSAGLALVTVSANGSSVAAEIAAGLASLTVSASSAVVDTVGSSALQYIALTVVGPYISTSIVDKPHISLGVLE